MFNRRHMLASTAAMGLTFALGSAAASRSRITYDVGTTPYPAAKSILRRRPRDLHAGSAGPHDLPHTLHANFALLVEYNFARLSDDTFKRAWHGLTRVERSMLVPLYDRSIAYSGARPRLLELVAERADLSTLVLVGSMFESVRVEEALMRFAPNKLPAFRNSIGVGNRHAQQLSSPELAPGLLVGGSMSGSMLDYTLREIYLSYRTAPVGALGITASLFEATRYVSKNLVYAYGGGYTLGTLFIAPLIREYAPSLWHNIGATVHHTVEALSSVQDTFAAANQERAAAEVFNVPSEPYFLLQDTGGDFGVVWAWNEVYGGSGGNPFCGTLEACPPMSDH